MRRGVRQSAFTLIELLVAMAIILLLGGALLGVGKYMSVHASVDLTEGELEVLTTALQQYYADTGNFPFITEKDYSGDGSIDVYDESHLEFDLNGMVLPDEAINQLISAESGYYASSSSSALFYFLDQNPSSRTIIESLTDSLISNKDAVGQNIKLEKPASSGNLIDLPRFVDAWGTSIRYEYLPGTAFPTLTSAGPDEVFGTPDDIAG